MGEAINLVENFKVEKVIFNCGEFNELEIDLIKFANATNYQVGKEIRNTIKKLGGTMPEKLPTADKSLKKLEKEVKNNNKHLCNQNID